MSYFSKVLWSIVFLTLSATMVWSQHSKPLGSVNHYRITKLKPFKEKVCTIFTTDHQIHTGRLEKIDFRQISLRGDSGPIHNIILQVPIYQIEKITCGLQAQVFVSQAYIKELIPIMQADENPDQIDITRELIAILEESAPETSEFADLEDELEINIRNANATMEINE